ncbi:hypothetical protein MLD38_006028 [Melastoma candidum]|uniref:Uncharacterized protein n=1 Tax=Melastoma candidum TaxID=119954 RepID=A0ACB9RM64_9MYRT|nr:hypothetical protein MLD38_006028 [Melastoma candidum]
MKGQEANWELYMKQKSTEAIQYQKEEAATQKAQANAEFYTWKQAADATMYGKKLEAEGMVALADNQGRYLGMLLEALGGNYAALGDCMMINGGMFQGGGQDQC